MSLEWNGVEDDVWVWWIRSSNQMPEILPRKVNLLVKGYSPAAITLSTWDYSVAVPSKNLEIPQKTCWSFDIILVNTAYVTALIIQKIVMNINMDKPTADVVVYRKHIYLENEGKIVYCSFHDDYYYLRHSCLHAPPHSHLYSVFFLWIHNSPMLDIFRIEKMGNSGDGKKSIKLLLFSYQYSINSIKH